MHYLGVSYLILFHCLSGFFLSKINDIASILLVLLVRLQYSTVVLANKDSTQLIFDHKSINTTMASKSRF